MRLGLCVWGAGPWEKKCCSYYFIPRALALKMPSMVGALLGLWAVGLGVSFSL